jgi:hypothetical protein
MISLQDGRGGQWPVQYEGLEFKGPGKSQRHLRLTNGWRYFVRDKDITIGKETGVCCGGS